MHIPRVVSFDSRSFTARYVCSVPLPQSSARDPGLEALGLSCRLLAAPQLDHDEGPFWSGPIILDRPLLRLELTVASWCSSLCSPIHQGTEQEDEMLCASA